MSNQEYVEVIKDDVPSADRHGHMICETDTLINGRYRVVKKLGKGSFSRVIKAIDTKTDTVVALKISRNTESSRRAAKGEISVQRFISLRDRNDTSLCAKMIDSFTYNGHICITFEVLGSDIYQFLKHNDYVPFPLDQVRHIVYQLCYSVEFLHRVGIIHTDLKTDNILFVDSSYTKEFHHVNRRNIRLVDRTDIRLIDFGLADDDELPQSRTISNRLYRAPEVVLKANWSHPVDVWAIGCILYELYTGNLLFNTEDDNLEHLGIMERILGPFPEIMAADQKYFINGKSKFDWSTRQLELSHHKPLRMSMYVETDDHVQLFDLMEKMLAYEPSKRVMLKDALTHPFFDRIPPDQRLTPCF